MSRASWRLRAVAGMWLMSAAGCPLEEPASDADRLSASDAGVLLLDAPPLPPQPVSALDVLFVIDNSGSMASKQAKLRAELARMVHVLTTGDRYADREEQVPPGLPEKSRRFSPVRSLHLGVVSTNMGGLEDLPSTTSVALTSCGGLGDDAKLQFSTTLAVEGLVAYKNEFVGQPEGSRLIAPDPSCALPLQPAYQSFSSSDDASAMTHAFECVARLGVRGCPFEQPLEAMWKALAPSSRAATPSGLLEFSGGTAGQGELANAGFLRSDAVLAVVHLTDEDDCSITDAGKLLFAQTGDADELGPLNLRCGLHASDSALERGIERYVSGLRALKPGHPERVVFAAVAGMPVRAIETGATHEQILALPEMQFLENPESAGLPLPACVGGLNAEENAYPAIRIVQLARALAPQSVLGSICAESYAHVVDQVVDKIAPQMGE